MRLAIALFVMLLTIGTLRGFPGLHPAQNDEALAAWEALADDERTELLAVLRWQSNAGFYEHHWWPAPPAGTELEDLLAQLGIEPAPEWTWPGIRVGAMSTTWEKPWLGTATLAWDAAHKRLWVLLPETE